MTQQELLESIKSTYDQVDITAQNFNPFELFSGFKPDDDIKPLRKWALGKGMKAENFDRAHSYWRVTETLGGNPQTVEDYVSLYVARESITARFDGLLLAPRSGAVSANPDMAGLERDLRLLRDKLGLPYKDRAIADAVNKWLAGAKQARLEAAFAAIVSPVPPQADVDWLNFVTALVDTDKVSANYAMRVFQAAIWQVKRRLADDPAYPVTDHLMGVLSGPGRAGKSLASVKFFGPIQDLVAQTNFAEITDGRNFDLWNFPVLFLDEMENAERSDVEAIKNAITRSTKSGRALYSGTTSTVMVRSVFFGTANHSLGDKIADTTGVQRFGPVPTKHRPSPENIAEGLPVVDWAAIDATDFLKLWQSVDHLAAHPLQSDPAARAEWVELCEAERVQDSVEAWLRQADVEEFRFGLGSKKALTTADLYEEYRVGYSDWCKRSGMGALAMPKFGKRLKALSALPWYPFAPPKAAKNGTVHGLKDDGFMAVRTEPADILAKIRQRRIDRESGKVA